MAACVICKQILAVPDAVLLEANLQHFAIAHQPILQELGPLIGKFAQYITSLFLCGAGLEALRGGLEDHLAAAVAQIGGRAEALVQCPEGPAIAGTPGQNCSTNTFGS